MTHLLLISHDVVGPVMAGPGIRYYHLARVLSQHIETTLAIPAHSPGTLPDDAFKVRRYNADDWSSLALLIPPDAICLLPSDIAGHFPQIREHVAYCVIDGYDPLLAEWLALGAHQPPEQRHTDWRARMASLNHQYQIGDFFLCASERQRDWWLGLLEANGRINPATYASDPSLRNLIDVIAYGLPSAEPVHGKATIKGVWPGIHRDDKLLLWGGGLWPWLDPVTAIHALAELHASDPHIKLIFPGARHPNPKMAGMPDHRAAALDAAQKAGLLDVAVFFGDWVPYAQWPDLLLECDVALTLHFDFLETRLAYRSRVLEYIWAGLPVVAASGDATAELIDAYGLGCVVPSENVTAVVQAIRALLDEEPADTRQAAFASARRAMTWERVARPLIEYCQAPYHAADRQGGDENTYFPSFEVQLQRERQHWEALVRAYENGRFMRLMRWLQSWRNP